jgi:CheY-like chemotaxis protein
VELCGRQSFDVILMDVHMPEMDGIEATRLIRQQEVLSGHHVPIIALTASAMNEDKQECLESGMDDYMSKPFNPEELMRTVQAAPSSFAVVPEKVQQSRIKV